MSRCLICDEVIEETFGDLVAGKKFVCYNCFNKFKIRNEKFTIEGVEGFVLYYYDSFFKDILYRYKGNCNYLLKDIFFAYNLNKIKKKYKGYKIVLAPSNTQLELERGFCHLEAIFKSFDLEIIKCFEKGQMWKQSDKNLQERAEIQKVIKIDKRLLNGVKKVLIVDDVLTSGSTIRTMISQIPSNITKKVLVLSSNCQFLPNEIFGENI